MANELKGIQMVDGTKSGFTENDFENGYMYFVRTDSEKTEGYIYMNGKHYGLAPKEINCGEY